MTEDIHIISSETGEGIFQPLKIAAEGNPYCVSESPWKKDFTYVLDMMLGNLGGLSNSVVPTALQFNRHVLDNWCLVSTGNTEVIRLVSQLSRSSWFGGKTNKQKISPFFQRRVEFRRVEELI